MSDLVHLVAACALKPYRAVPRWTQLAIWPATKLDVALSMERFHQRVIRKCGQGDLTQVVLESVEKPEPPQLHIVHRGSACFEPNIKKEIKRRYAARS